MGIFLIFDISGGELLVIMLFILLFFGSKGIPDVARTMGRAMRQLRDASNEVQREINRGAHEVRKGIDEQRRAFTEEPTPQPPLRRDRHPRPWSRRRRTPPDLRTAALRPSDPRVLPAMAVKQCNSGSGYSFF